MNYEDMPLRGKISPLAWEFEHYGRWNFTELTNRNKRKLHRHYDPYNDWMTRPRCVAWSYKGPFISKGKKRKTWKDYK